MKPIQRMERLGTLNALEVLSVPFEQRERALAEVRGRCYSAAVATGISHRNAMRWANKMERITKGLVELVQLRL